VSSITVPSRSGGAQRRPEDAPGRRDQIVAAAAAVLGRQGYGGTSLKDVAREAGVAVGLLHYYFESKEQLLLEVVVDLETELTETWQGAVRGVEDPLERVVRALDRTAERCVERPDFWRLLFDLYVLGMGSEAVRTRLEAMRGRRIDEIEAEVRQVLGRLPSYAVIPPRDLAEAIAGAIEGIAFTGLVEGRDVRRAYSALKAMLMSLVVTAYVAAGKQPPIGRLSELLRRGAPAPRPG
jgi:AcrR family transcriptional regulator